MIEVETIKKLAALARIAVSPKEEEKLRGDIEAILAYVSEIQKAGTATPRSSEGFVNVMRSDVDPYPPGIFRETLLKALPERQGDYAVVKKIIAQ